MLKVRRRSRFRHRQGSLPGRSEWVAGRAKPLRRARPVFVIEKGAHEFSPLRPNPMTLAQFLEWEERQPLRYEFDGIGPVAMTGGSVGHSQSNATWLSP